MGAALMIGLRQLVPGIQFCGVGGPSMLHAGLDPVFTMDEISVMGLIEVIPKLPKLLQLRRRARKAIINGDFDALITIDCPDFNLSIARDVKFHKKSIPVIHYVSPTVWAWRPRRVVSIAKSVDLVLALFPFEAEFLRRSGIACSFVGHPIAQNLFPTNNEIVKSFNRVGLNPEDQVIVVLPGSRVGEVRRHSPIFAETIATLSEYYPKLTSIVVLAPTVANYMLDRQHIWPKCTRLFDIRDIPATESEHMKQSLFAGADAALAASGTVSLELAAARCPMVIGYDVNWLTRQILKPMLTIDTVTLVNLISNQKIVPEYLGKSLTSENLTIAMKNLLRDASLRQKQRDVFDDVLQRLAPTQESPGLYAARQVLNVIEQS